MAFRFEPAAFQGITLSAGVLGDIQQTGMTAADVVGDVQQTETPAGIQGGAPQ